MTDYDTQTPYIASYGIVRKGDQIAFVKRSNTAWMDGWYGLPSGKVEKGESFTEAAVRELLEEIGIKVSESDLKVCHVVHRRQETFWVDVYFEVINYDGEAYNAEPDVHSELAWFDPDDLPEKVIPSVRFALEQIKAGKIYSEYKATS